IAVELLDRIVPERLRPSPSSLVVAFVLSVVAAILLRFAGERLGESDYEFRAPVVLLGALASFGIVFPILVTQNFVSASWPRVAPRLLPASLFVAGALCQWFSHFVMAVVHLRGSACGATAIAIALYVLALLRALPPPSDAIPRAVPWVVPATAMFGLLVT